MADGSGARSGRERVTAMRPNQMNPAWRYVKITPPVVDPLSSVTNFVASLGALGSGTATPTPTDPSCANTAGATTSTVYPTTATSDSLFGNTEAFSGLSNIKHIIFMVQENRSFDSYFGTYPGADGILVENFGDAPFYPAEVPPVTTWPTVKFAVWVLKSSRMTLAVVDSACSTVSRSLLATSTIWIERSSSRKHRKGTQHYIPLGTRT